jgi:hypothetical protein
VVDLERFATSGLFDQLLPGTPYPEVSDMFGEPELDWPMNKRAPLFVKYGDIEFMFRFHRLTTAACNLVEGRPIDGGRLPVQGFWPESRRTRAAVADLLAHNGVTWELDVRASSMTPEESSQVWVTENHVHLAFFQGTLQSFLADYGPMLRD